MSLVVQEMTCRRGGVAVFAPVSFSLDKGEAARLLGPNGAGKTTLLRSLAGLGLARDGTVLWDGAPFAAEGTVAYLGHLDAVKAALTVRENVIFWARLSGREDAVDAALEAFGLTSLAPRLAGRLSAGQRRRTGLARLLVTDAPLWLLDEPTVALDAASLDRLGAVLAAHLAGGGMVLAATHQPLPIETTAITLDRAQPEAAVDPFLEAL